MHECAPNVAQTELSEDTAVLSVTSAALARVGLTAIPGDSRFEAQGHVPVRAGTIVAWSEDLRADVHRARALVPGFTAIALEEAGLRFVDPAGDTACIVASAIRLGAESALVVDAGVRHIMLVCSSLTVEPGAWIRWEPVLGSTDAPKLTIDATAIHGALPTIALRGHDGGAGGVVEVIVDERSEAMVRDRIERDRHRIDVRPGLRLATPFTHHHDPDPLHAAADRGIGMTPRVPLPPAMPRVGVLPALAAVGEHFYAVAHNLSNVSRIELQRLQGGVLVWVPLSPTLPRPTSTGFTVARFAVPSGGPEARGGPAKIRVVDTVPGWKSAPCSLTITPRLDAIANYGAQLTFGGAAPTSADTPWHSHATLLPSTWIALRGDGFSDGAQAEVVAADGTIAATLPCVGDGMFLAAQLPDWSSPLASGSYRIRVRNADGNRTTSVPLVATTRISMRVRLWKLARAAGDDMSDAYLSMVHDMGKREAPVNYWAAFGIDIKLDTVLTRALVPSDLVGDWPTPAHPSYGTSQALLETPAHFDPGALNIYLAQRISHQHYGWTYGWYVPAGAPGGNAFPCATIVVAKGEEILDLVGQRGDQTRFTTIHEMGHAFGLPHWCARKDEDPAATTTGRKCGDGDDDHLMRAGFRLSYTPNMTAGELAIVRSRARWFHER